MKTALSQISLKEQRSQSFNSLLVKFKRDLTPTISANPSKKSLPHLNNDKPKQSYTSLNTSKKYSILSVPKTPTELPVVSNSITPVKQVEKTSRLNLHNIENSITTTRPTVNQDFKFSKKSRVRLGNNYRKNPNQENLKIALLEIENNPSKRFILSENKNLEPQLKAQKSDIENLLESQGNQLRKKREKKTKLEESVTENKSGPVESGNTESRVLDTNIESKEPFEAQISQTPKSEKSLSEDKSEVFKIIKNKADSGLLVKTQSNQESSKNVISTQTQREHTSKALIDYRQESLKILKDTSFFANKIMKAIRCPARIKFFFYN